MGYQHHGPVHFPVYAKKPILHLSPCDHIQGADLCLLAQLVVTDRDPKQQAPTPENSYYCADTMMGAAAVLRSAGVQFLRAAGDATPAYTGVLAAAVAGQDVRLSE